MADDKSDTAEAETDPGLAEGSVQPLALGQRVRELRLSRNLTLEEASRLTGLARSTLSKIENEQISPTFAAMSKLVSGLGIDMPQLFAEPKRKPPGGLARRDITRKNEGVPRLTPTYEHELLADQISNKRMIPFKTTVRARSREEYEEWVRHDGEEMLYVLQGCVLFYSEFYEPVVLHEGDSVYYDGAMGHLLVSTSEKDAEVLWVTA